MTQRPVAVGLLLCEQVIVEEHTGNVTPVNCFSFRIAENVPGESAPFTVVAFLTDGIGKVTLKVTIERLDTLEEIYERETSVTFPEPLYRLRLIARVRGCFLPVEGDYTVNLLANGETIAQNRFRLLQKER